MVDTEEKKNVTSARCNSAGVYLNQNPNLSRVPIETLAKASWDFAVIGLNAICGFHLLTQQR
jgi:hypothetical protein